jgi:hypothetical protein
MAPALIHDACCLIVVVEVQGMTRFMPDAQGVSTLNMSIEPTRSLALYFSIFCPTVDVSILVEAGATYLGKAVCIMHEIRMPCMVNPEIELLYLLRT